MRKLITYIILISLFVNTSNASMMCCGIQQSPITVLNEVSSDQVKPPCHGIDQNNKGSNTLKSMSASSDSECCDCYDCVQINGIVLEQLLSTFLISDLNHIQPPHSLGLTIKSIFDPPILIS